MFGLHTVLPLVAKWRCSLPNFAGYHLHRVSHHQTSHRLSLHQVWHKNIYSQFLPCLVSLLLTMLQLTWLPTCCTYLLQSAIHLPLCGRSAFSSVDSHQPCKSTPIISAKSPLFICYSLYTTPTHHINKHLICGSSCVVPFCFADKCSVILTIIK